MCGDQREAFPVSYMEWLGFSTLQVGRGEGWWLKVRKIITEELAVPLKGRVWNQNVEPKPQDLGQPLP